MKENTSKENDRDMASILSPTEKNTKVNGSKINNTDEAPTTS